MKKKAIPGIAILLGAALVAIAVTQLFWLNNAYHIKEEQLNRSVVNAMRSTVNKIEDRYNVSKLLDTFDQRIYGIPSRVKGRTVKGGESSNLMQQDIAYVDSLVNSVLKSSKFSYKDDQNRVIFRIKTPEGMMENSFVLPDLQNPDQWQQYQYGQQNQQPLKLDSHKKKSRKNQKVQQSPFENEISMPFEMKSPANEAASRKEAEQFLRTHIEKRSRRIENAIRQMILEFDTKNQPIEKRIKASLIDSTLKAELRVEGIEVPFEYAIYDDKGDEITGIRSKGYLADKPSSYKTPLFPYDIGSESYSLQLQLDNPRSYILGSLNFLLVGSILLMAFILITFTFTIVTLLKQKRLSEVKSDFVNNVTHEFKTPIATINLAVDSIDNDKVIKKEDAVKYFTGIIRDENRRMNRLVEQVLKMALVERAGLKQNPQTLDIHDVINTAVGHFELQIANKGGTIVKEFNASNPVVEADEMHMLNALVNLIDNAIKYSPSQPFVKICTFNTSNKLNISVIDKGIGMKKDAQRHIFDKFYRHTDGNIHNIKGFGLGLAFVKSIVEAHNGRISVSSELGKGSRFDITIPQKNS
ncbi:HAMP domain-containing sensor histidine kinase [uncultured Acetobacteroides sp.]|uniref:sensor histidine kinase n=1 Tax=uncultured Acetobacteroides sp. TaxID=1760811 RepID=UPI0029F46A42|nr:HAMP domain-containing sensor histidine kinase [uncultured Acetobacteroides sp.]